MSSAATRRELAERFETFVKRLLQIQGLEIIEPPAADQEFDFIAKTKSGKTAAVEVKLYWSIEPPKAPLRRSLQQVLGAANRNSLDHAILITNAKVDDEIESFIRLNPKYVFYDYSVLWNLCLADLRYLKEFRDITTEAFEFQDSQTPSSEPVTSLEFIGELAAAQAGLVPNTEQDARAVAKKLCDDLRKLSTGVGPKFEHLGTEILQFVFEGELGNWKKQRQSHNKIHRYDAIARVVGRSGFWNALIADFRSRYIIFEFKNYADKISQSEIYSTEKYLMPLAMRGTAIVVTRNGATKNAITVMAGALRESGKLIICIDDDDLCRMLKLRSNGDDPAVVLADKLDDLLECLER